MKVIKKRVIPPLPEVKLFRGTCPCGCEVEVTDKEVTEYKDGVKGPTNFLWTEEICPECAFNQIKVDEVLT